MSKKKPQVDNKDFSLLDILWRIVAPIIVAVCHTLWNVYGETILELIRRAFTL